MGLLLLGVYQLFASILIYIYIASDREIDRSEVMRLNHYIINKKTVLVTGEYDEYGKQCTRVVEGDLSIFVNKSPDKVLEETLNYYGNNLKGAIEGAKSILGNIHMTPFIVSQVQDICLFPYKSSKHHDCIWFNFSHIENTRSQGRYTVVELSNKRSLKIIGKLTAFNNKKHKAGELRRIVSERANITVSLHNPILEYMFCEGKGIFLFDKP